MAMKKFATAVASCLGATALIMPLASPIANGEPLPAEQAPHGEHVDPKALPELPPLPQLPPAPQLPEWPPLLDIAGMVGPENAPPRPNQDNPKNYVSFGDSMASNPTIADIQAERAIDNGANITWPTVVADGVDGKCAQGPDNYAQQVAERTGLRLDDYSCSGLTVYSEQSQLVPGKRVRIAEYVDKAIADGALNENTELVTILVGFNEFYQKDTWALTNEEREKAFMDNLVPSLNAIKEHAPNANLQVLGYPDETDGRNNTCGSNLLGLTTTFYFPPIAFFQDKLYDYQRSAAEQAGFQYLPFKDEINVNHGNSGCQQNGPRLNSTIFDDSPHRLSIHLTDNGHEYYGARIAEEYNNHLNGTPGHSDVRMPELPPYEADALINQLTAPLPWNPELPR